MSSLPNACDPDWSYGRHSSHEGEEAPLPSCYTAPRSVDAWRHRRMLDTLSPLLESVSDATWLTIGDGAYGTEAHYLRSRGARATASSLTDSRLALAHARGLIDGYRVENAEAISLQDDAYDFVICKEAYHHFPRPPIAFYEMLRVARRAAIFIEPIDGPARVLGQFKKLAKKILRGDTELEFEPSGNYIFRMSIRETQKMLTALNGSCLAYKMYNDFYYAPAASHNHDELTSGRLITGAGLIAQDLLCRMRLLNYGLATLVVFKRAPEITLCRALRRYGYRVRTMPANPYLK